jgi:hypothetical protein
MQHDLQLRAAARAIYDACYPSDEWAPVGFDEAERFRTVHYRQAVGAALHHALAGDGRLSTTILWPYVDDLAVFGGWWRQLWAESLGKDGQGSTPVSVLGPVDQHSQLQLYLDGPRDKLFTVVDIAENSDAIANPAWARRHGLDLLAGRDMCNVAQAQARVTHADRSGNAFQRLASRTTLAAARRSSIRLLVQEPMNTRSIGIAEIGVPLSNPMYSSARAALERSLGSVMAVGSGTVASTPTTCARASRAGAPTFTPRCAGCAGTPRRSARASAPTVSTATARS